LVQILENRGKCSTSVKDIGWFGRAAVHEDVKCCVLREQSHLALCVAAIGAMSISIDQFPDRETVRSLLQRHGLSFDLSD
jgi:hypothetical protein